MGSMVCSLGMFRLVEFTLTHSVMTSFIHVRFDGAYTERQKERNQFLGSHSPKFTASNLMGLVTLGGKKEVSPEYLLEFYSNLSQKLPEFVTLAFRGRGRSVWRTVTPSPPPPSPGIRLWLCTSCSLGSIIVRKKREKSQAPLLVF